MNKYEPEMKLSESEIKVRRDWRAIFIIFSFIMLTLNFGAFSALLLEWDTSAANILLGLVLAQAIFFAFFYYFAFMKFGTKWIALFIFMSPFKNIETVLKETITLLNSSSLTAVETSIALIVNLLSFSLYGYFWMHCLRLYRLNKSLKKKNPLKNLNDLKLERIV